MRNHYATWIGTTALLALALGACASRAATPGPLDDAALLAYAKQPWDKATLMHTTVELGRHHGQRVVAEYPCGDVCPQYTARVIHYELAPGATGLDVVCEVDGVVLQQGSTDLLLFDIASILADIRVFTRLEPGDVILTGTPAGVGAGRDPQVWLRPGQTVVSRISGVGEIRNRIVGPAEAS